MHSPILRVGAAGVILVVASCGSMSPDTATPSPSDSPTSSTLERAARADSVRQHYTRADVAFMTGMIHHHAQALVMARMAPTHDASESLRTLAARIINGQTDEIRLMQRWLRERGEPVPVVEEDGTTHMPDQHGDAAEHPGDAAGHPGDAAGHPMSMAGMLTPDQLARLDAARGEAWDELFLRYMIQHHQGALVMVDELFATHGAGQGDEIFKIASDIGADQATEIDRMQRMLQARLFDAGGP